MHLCGEAQPALSGGQRANASHGLKEMTMWSSYKAASGLNDNASHGSKDMTMQSSYKVESGGTYGFLDAIL